MNLNNYKQDEANFVKFKAISYYFPLFYTFLKCDKNSSKTKKYGWELMSTMVSVNFVNIKKDNTSKTDIHSRPKD